MVGQSCQGQGHPHEPWACWRLARLGPCPQCLYCPQLKKRHTCVNDVGCHIKCSASIVVNPIQGQALLVDAIEAPCCAVLCASLDSTHDHVCSNCGHHCAVHQRLYDRRLLLQAGRELRPSHQTVFFWVTDSGFGKGMLSEPEHVMCWCTAWRPSWAGSCSTTSHLVQHGLLRDYVAYLGQWQ
jgi:hypothetical protein